MFCAKCGSQLNEGIKFCSSCGSPVQQDTTATTAQNSGVGKKSSKKLPIIIGSIAAVVLVCILLFSNLWAIAPKAYYGKLESRNAIVSLDDMYQKVLKATDIKPFAKDVGITISEFGDIGMLENILKGLEVRAQIDYSKGQSSLYASCKYMNNVLVDSILYNDKDIVGIGMPVLYDRSFIANKEEISQVLTNLTGSEINMDLKTIQELKEQVGQDIKVLDKVINRYGKLAFKNIPSNRIKISKGDEPISIYSWNSGKSESALELDKYKSVEVKLTERDLNIIADNVLSELQNDEELLKIISKYAQLSEKISYGFYNTDSISDAEKREEFVEELKEQIEDARQELDLEEDYDEDEDFVISMTSIVDKKDNIVSRKINIDNNVVTINRFQSKDDLMVTEVNISEGRLGLGDQIANLFIFDSKDYRGIRLTTEYEGTMELYYKRSSKGKNGSGIDYGEYRALMHSRNEQYILSLKVDPKSGSKNSELYKLELQQNGQDLIVLEIQADELKNKSKMKFSKDGAVDLALTDPDELEEIFYNIGSRLEDTLYEMQGMIYSR